MRVREHAPQAKTEHDGIRSSGRCAYIRESYRGPEPKPESFEHAPRVGSPTPAARHGSDAVPATAAHASGSTRTPTAAPGAYTNAHLTDTFFSLQNDVRN